MTSKNMLNIRAKITRFPIGTCGLAPSVVKAQLLLLIDLLAKTLGFTPESLEKLSTLDGKFQKMASSAFEWARRGFPSCADIEARIREGQKHILAWAYPAGITTCRENKAAWCLLYSLSLVRGLRALWVHQSRKQHLRVILRAVHPDMQATLLGGPVF